MGLFKSKYEKELDGIISNIEMNMANNYKDNAQAGLREFESSLTSMKEQQLIKGKAAENYERQLLAYRERLKGYTHKDQKPYWTK